MPGAIGFVATYPRPFPGIHALSAENRSPRRHKSKAVSLDCDVSKRALATTLREPLHNVARLAAALWQRIGPM